jgi:hypothetical protein
MVCLPNIGYDLTVYMHEVMAMVITPSTMNTHRMVKSISLLKD